ncbi:MAG: hypothetical protein HY554_09950 [Elusimicrobia bacterium]|nr:hypothetical protein [Elusimicrobiota bacterium]
MECREAAAARFLRRHARRSNEPAEILSLRVGGEAEKDRELLRALSRAPGVRRLSDRKDSGWAAEGEGVEYPIDRARVVRAEVRWTRRPQGERLELLRLR